MCRIGRYFLIVASNPHPDDGPSDLRLALNVVLIFRLLRLLKLLAVFSPTKKILWTLQRVAPSMARLLFIIVAVFYGFAIVGVDVFQDIPGPNGYVTELTFDSFPAAMLTLFEVRPPPPPSTRLPPRVSHPAPVRIIRCRACRCGCSPRPARRLGGQVSMLSSWPMVMDVTQAHTTRWAQVYFYLFHVIAVMLLLPVFIGFIVESFVSNYAQVEAEFKKEEAEVRERYQRWKEEHKRRKARRRRRAERNSTREGSKRRLRGGVDGGSVGSAFDSGAESAPGSVPGAAPGTAVAVGADGDGGSVASDSSEHSVAFNYEEEAAVEMAIRRRTSDVNYVMFDVSGALQQADYDKLLDQHRAQVTELARRQERIHHMASKLLSQTSEIRRLEVSGGAGVGGGVGSDLPIASSLAPPPWPRVPALLTLLQEEVSALRLALSRGTAGRAVSRLKQMSLTVKSSRPPRAGAPDAPRSAESKQIRQTASMHNFGARRGGQTARRRVTEVAPRSHRGRNKLLDAMAEAQAAAVVAQGSGSGGGSGGGSGSGGGDDTGAATQGGSNGSVGACARRAHGSFVRVAGRGGLVAIITCCHCVSPVTCLMYVEVAQLSAPTRGLGPVPLPMPSALAVVCHEAGPTPT